MPLLPLTVDPHRYLVLIFVVDAAAVFRRFLLLALVIRNREFRTELLSFQKAFGASRFVSLALYAWLAEN
jgi:hypothetical protein